MMDDITIGDITHGAPILKTTKHAGITLHYWRGPALVEWGKRQVDTAHWWGFATPDYGAAFASEHNPARALRRCKRDAARITEEATR